MIDLVAMDPVLVFGVGIALAAVGFAFGAEAGWRCGCPDCVIHRRKDQERAELRRVKDHRNWHSRWGIEWGADHCPHCRAGNERDRPY